MIVMLGDVVNSRRVTDRTTLAAGMERARDRLNDKFAGELAMRMTILKGIDEVGVALASVEQLYDMLSMLTEELWPERMRFVVVAGEVDTGAGGRELARVDGPAVHRAAEMMADLKRSRLLFAMSVSDPLMDQALSGVMSMLLDARTSLTERQREVVGAYERLGGQAAAASELGVSQQAVSHVLVGIGHRQLVHVEAGVRDVLAGYWARLEEVTDVV